ncbi:hypothetical protein N7475_000203 [Penicillium sp. IBT 31633x]|nr:hypothetical protein N7475_000203 [Penicillium sp. IBT 31633x]
MCGWDYNHWIYVQKGKREGGTGGRIRAKKRKPPSLGQIFDREGKPDFETHNKPFDSLGLACCTEKVQLREDVSEAAHLPGMLFVEDR